jgi:hypothetical protein
MSCQAGTAMTDQAGMLQLNDTSFLDALLSSADGSDVQLLSVDDNMFMSYLLALDDTAAGSCDATCSYAAPVVATFMAWDEAHCKSLHAYRCMLTTACQEPDQTAMAAAQSAAHRTSHNLPAFRIVLTHSEPQSGQRDEQATAQRAAAPRIR